jgi:hypothetical protein
MRLSTIPRPVDPRLSRYSHMAYEAFRIGENGRSSSLKIDGEPQSLNEALSSVLPACMHKDKLVIRATSGGQAKLHLYEIKRKSQPIFVHENHATRRVHPLYAEQWCSLDCGGALFGEQA